MTKTEIVRRASVEELVGFYDSALVQYETAMAAVSTASTMWCRATGDTYGAPSEYLPRRSDLGGYKTRLTQQCWRRVIAMTDIQTLMDVNARKEFDAQIEREPPEFTVDNIVATLTDLLGRADEIFHRSVIATFESLPREYRSNDGFKYGKRIIFDFACSDAGRWGWSFYGDNYAAQRLRDLDRVFSALDTEKHDGSLDAVGVVSNACHRKKQWEATSRYFELKGYAKGSLHVRPLRKDLLDKANRILAAHYGWTLGDGRRAA